MKTAVTLAVLVFMSTIPVSDARRGQKLVESLEMKQGECLASQWIIRARMPWSNHRFGMSQVI